MKNHTLKKTVKATLIAMTATVLIGTFLTTNGCKKDTRNPTTPTVSDETSEAMVAHILEFKDRMAYYHENPNLKTGGHRITSYNVCYTKLLRRLHICRKVGKIQLGHACKNSFVGGFVVVFVHFGQTFFNGGNLFGQLLFFLGFFGFILV